MKIILGVAGWTFRLIVLAILLFLMTNCTMLGLNYASLEVGNKPDARPEIDAASLAEWEAGREGLVQTFEALVYGPWPEGQDVQLVGRRMVDDHFPQPCLNWQIKQMAP